MNKNCDPMKQVFRSIDNIKIFVNSHNTCCEWENNLGLGRGICPQVDIRKTRLASNGQKIK